MTELGAWAAMAEPPTTQADMHCRSVRLITRQNCAACADGRFSTATITHCVKSKRRRELLQSFVHTTLLLPSSSSQLASSAATAMDALFITAVSDMHSG